MGAATPFLPTPSEAAQARASAGFFDRLGSTALHKLPYVGPAYNIGSTIAHLIEGTQGQYGPATSLLGKLTAWLSGNPTNAPRAIPVNPTNPAQPQAQPAPAQAQPTSLAAAATGGQIPFSNWYNQVRSSFSPSFVQLNNPGSAIGPTGTSVVNPYVNTGHGTPNSVTTSIPGWAAAFSSLVNSQNQL